MRHRGPILFIVFSIFLLTFDPSLVHAENSQEEAFLEIFQILLDEQTSPCREKRRLENGGEHIPCSCTGSGYHCNGYRRGGQTCEVLDGQYYCPGPCNADSPGGSCDCSGDAYCTAHDEGVACANFHPSGGPDCVKITLCDDETGDRTLKCADCIDLDEDCERRGIGIGGNQTIIKD